MAGQRINIMDIKKILQLKIKGSSNRAIAKVMGLSRNTINDYVKRFEISDQSYAALLELSNKALHDLFGEKDYKDQERFVSLSKWLDQHITELQQVGCTKETLWYQYKLHIERPYGYTQFVYYLNQRLEKKDYSGILEHKAGATLQIDFTGKKLSYINKDTGERIAVEFFLGVLPHSQYAYGQVCHSQKVEDFLDCLNNCFESLGGVPHTLVPDNLKSAVVKANRYMPKINDNLKKLALHYNTAVLPARSRKPKDKAIVEGAVKLIYQRVFYPLADQQFFSLQALNQAVQKQMKIYNQYLFHNSKINRSDLFIEEQKSLQPLPVSPYQQRTFKKAKVQKTSFVYLYNENQYFSVPYRYIGQKVDVEYNHKVVEVYHKGERIALHNRNNVSSKYVTIEDHLPSSHQAFRAWSPDYFKTCALKVGANTALYIEALINQFAYPEHAFKQAQGILSLSKAYGRTELEQACTTGLQMTSYGMSKIQRILKNKTYQHPETNNNVQLNIGIHENLRDPNQYV